MNCSGSCSSGVVGEWKVAPLRRDMLVLTVGRPDALDEGVRAGDVVFVVRRGWLKDMVRVRVSGQVWVPSMLVVRVRGRLLGFID